MVLACVSVIYGGAQATSAGTAGGAAAAAAGHERMGVVGPPPGAPGGDEAAESEPTAAPEAPVDPTGTERGEAQGLETGEEPSQILPAPAPASDPPDSSDASDSSVEPADDAGPPPPAADGDAVEPEPPVVDDGVTLIDDGSAPWQSWSFDGFWQVDRPLADPGVLDQPAL